MAENYEYGSFISRADEEILEALTIADEIGKETINEKGCLFEDSAVTSIDNLSEQIYSSGSGDLSELYKTNTSIDCNVTADFCTLQTMCHLLVERKKIIQDNNSTFLKNAVAHNLLSDTILSERLNGIDAAVNHILAIVKQKSNIKQVLQDKPWKSTLKVDPACQKDVLRFFAEANELMKILKEGADFIENYGKHSIGDISSDNEALLESRVREVMVKYAKRIDLISNFRKQLPPSPDSDPVLDSSAYHSDSASYYPNSLSCSALDIPVFTDSESNLLSFK